MGRLQSWRSIGIVLGLILVATAVRVPGLYGRAIWYDEAITFLVTSGHARPDWPRTPTLAQDAKEQVLGTTSLDQISAGLKDFDVHPPLYFWIASLWKRSIGSSIEAARWLSLLCSVGAVLVFYSLLKRCRARQPAIVALIFALTSYGIFLGTDARPYALSMLLVWMTALFGYLSVETFTRNRGRAAIYAVVAGCTGGLAFGTGYMTLFSVLTVIVWHFVSLWRNSRLHGIIPAVVTLLTGSFAWTFLPSQLGRRARQYGSFPGLWVQVTDLLKANLEVLYIPAFDAPKFTYIVWGFLILLSILSLVLLVKNRHTENRSGPSLLLGLAVVPSLGIAMMNLALDRNVRGGHYVAMAGPALAWIVAYGVIVILTASRRWGIILLILLFGLQLTGINWGKERTPLFGGSNAKSLNQMIQTTSSPSQLVVIGGGYGRGKPAVATYALAPDTVMLVLDNDTNLDDLLAKISSNEDIWILPSWESRTADIESQLIERLKMEKGYAEVFARWDSVHLVREP